MKTEDPPLIIIDGECILCDGAARFIIRHSRPAEFRFALLQDEPSDLGMDTVVVVASGKRYVRGEAVLFILERLPRLRFWWRCASLLPSPLLDLGYRCLARYRYRIWGRKACSLPGKR